MPQLADCTVFTEPALFAYSGDTYLATSCVVFDGGVRMYDQERLVLLREEAVGYSYAGFLLDSDDAVAFGGTTIEQADLAYARDGGLLLTVTPIDNGGSPEHLGCYVFEVTNLPSAQVLRDGGGTPVPLAHITGDDPVIGPGACTYDPASETGMLMHVHEHTPSPFDMQFTVRATGVHPTTTLGDSDGDTWANGAEATIGTNPSAACGFTPAGDPASDSWPADLVESNSINISDVLALKPVFNTAVPPTSARYDISPGSGINISDVLRLKPVFNTSCTP
jgi:hypothetical protein